MVHMTDAPRQRETTFTFLPSRQDLPDSGVLLLLRQCQRRFPRRTDIHRLEPLPFSGNTSKQPPGVSSLIADPKQIRAVLLHKTENAPGHRTISAKLHFQSILQQKLRVGDSFLYFQRLVNLCIGVDKSVENTIQKQMMRIKNRHHLLFWS